MNKMFLISMTVFMLLTTKMSAQTYFAAELTVKGQFAYVQMPENTKAIAGKLLKGKATEITKEQFTAILAGEKVAAIKINGVAHTPIPGPVAKDGGYKWCSYETPSGGTAYYQCKVPKSGADCCTMVIVLTPTTPEK